MSKFLFFVFFLIWSISGSAQNSVMNGDFETYTALPNTYAEVCYASGWDSPSGICALVVGTGSPDYYNALGSGGANPPNTFWATVTPHSGAGMEGFAAWYATATNYREYISSQFSSPLTVGTDYIISFWITNGIGTTHGYGCSNIGIALSLSPLVQTAANPITFLPQCEIGTVFYNTGWQQISFYFTATAAYNYITIGNFRDDASTSATLMGTGTSGAYYYVDDVSVAPATTLPVGLMSFEGNIKDNDIELSWKTASEKDNHYFNLERKINGEPFQTIARIEGHGTTTSMHTYNYEDKDVIPSVVYYYRLKQVDYNGAFSYSKIIAVRNSNNNVNMLAAPNPFVETTDIIYSVKNKTGITIELFDITGKKIKTLFNGSKDAGDYSFVFNAAESNCPPGIYFLRLIADDKVYNLKLVKGK
jgi:hypothetical protein